KTLSDKGKNGDRVLLLFPTGIEFITSFFGCLFAGMIAVPTYPPKRNKANERFHSIIEDSGPEFIISTRDIHEEVNGNELLGDRHKIGSWLIFEDIDTQYSSTWEDPEISEEDLALLQYTSGSTGTPNGVMVSHGNIINNSEFIKQSFGFDENSVGVNWLPNFHDMGLIGCLIQAAYLGATNVIIPPLSFLKNPANWFRAVSHYRATTAGGPNFAFDYCIEKISDEELSEFSLESLRTLYCGAEPIRDRTMKLFTQKFKASGFRASQLFPVYGMAEVVLILSGGDFRAEPIYFSLDTRELENNRVLEAPPGNHSRTLTACGYPWMGMQVAIVDPDTLLPAPAGTIGEIWANGPSVARGYWNDPEATDKTFNACISVSGSGPWLRTGDLGFIHDGQIYVSGRLKDLIIIRGSNFFPNDIEHTVESSHQAIRQNASAAFSADIKGEEQLVIVAELERQYMRDIPENEIMASVRERIFREYNIQPYAIVLIRTGSILKTSSGKIQRSAVRNAWEKDQLNILAIWERPLQQEDMASRLPFRPAFLREWLINWMAQKLEINPNSIDPNKPVSAYGLDSMAAVSLEKDVKEQFGVEWPIESFLKENSVNQLVEEGMELLRNKT
ncbi:MAG TPA: AMP-binding protein, partial [Bacteroidales bacterium]|nr:AMP-binding protein [Bacteroidales bacterium]